MGQDHSSRQPRGQHADAAPDGISGRAFTDSLYSAHTFEGREYTLLQLLSAWTSRRGLPGHSQFAHRQRGRQNTHGAARSQMAAYDRTSEYFGLSGTNGAGKGGARAFRRSNSARNLRRQLFGPDAR